MRNMQRLATGLILFCVLLLVGCQATTGHYLGARAEHSTVLSLSDVLKAEPHWQDLYVNIDYQVQQLGNQLVTEGVFTFADYPQLNKARVYDFKLKLFLLNKEHLVVDYFDLYRTLGPSLREQMAFRKSVQISPEVTALSFGYEGVFIDETGARDSVWKLPKRNF